MTKPNQLEACEFVELENHNANCQSTQGNHIRSKNKVMCSVKEESMSSSKFFIKKTIVTSDNMPYNVRMSG